MVLTVMQDEVRGGITVTKAGIHDVRKLCEKAREREQGVLVLVNTKFY